jgi:hypothetical protein
MTSSPLSPFMEIELFITSVVVIASDEDVLIASNASRCGDCSKLDYEL